MNVQSISPAVAVAIALFVILSAPAHGGYPVDRPVRSIPAPMESNYVVHPDQLRQVIKGIGFEIQCDSIASGNKSLPEETTSVPHDLVPEERARFCREMLKGFRYCRLAGGPYWRGLDAERKQLQPRWPEQLAELREMIQAAGIEGIDFEYWSPAPYWKANGRYAAAIPHDPENKLRCFGNKFDADPDYHGDTSRFLNDFATACRNDLQTLKDNGLPVVFWGLQNEPFANVGYSSCAYTPAEYAQTFKVVAPVIRRFDPKIRIIADTDWSWKFRYIRSVLNDPASASLVNDLVIHHIGVDAKDDVPPIEPSGRPRFENEFEYLDGKTSSSRCLNTVEDIMNWFQLAHAPAWFWIHALKPTENAEAPGYALGFWRPISAAGPANDPQFRGLQPGFWTWNNDNWFAVGSFTRHMPWNCQAVGVTEEVYDNDLRILAFRRPNGKLSIVLSNRSFGPHTFHIDTGRDGTTFNGYRYTPNDAGDDCRGVELPALTGRIISPKLDDLSWEFWEEQ